ncbi:MAG: histidine--tRNA ligase [Spirochaetes bacterium]|nr:histidine--tRNA ligase [Spirochaetota bacterium]NLJ04570.1 histidine--tRNA ligase [Exilispira sp.]MBP8991016.1 histidine--tRNA ligase [Spirochaetota bacterium]HNV43665.1 histidine--tRNA ligase [Exilispira sp.]HOV45419.1 histidine--tRNA ligase [Exilispira sp.]
MIEPKTLKGFKDSLPSEEVYRKNLISNIEKTLSLYGYYPIDTPALEYKEILLGKGGDENDKQIFLFKDKGERDVGLRYDLTVPLARFVSQHFNQLTFPFKRYHIAKVWRGEKPQKGRFREFYQADFDIIGTNSLSSDVEIIFLVFDLIRNLGISDFSIKINDRKLMHDIFMALKIETFEKQILSILDKYYKVSEKEILHELESLINSKATIILELVQKARSYDFFDYLKEEFGINKSRLEEVFEFFHKMQLSNFIKLDLAITRGLDYYTGLVFETFINDGLELGSICSGGRYDNLTALFSDITLTGIGGSIGLDRLITYLTEKKPVDESFSNRCLIANFSEKDLPTYFDLAYELRKEGLTVEIYLEPARLKKQFQYAEQKKFRFLLLMGEEEISRHVYKLKDINSGEEQEYENIEKLCSYLKNPQKSTNL